MAITFPNSPALNETMVYNSVTYQWDGYKWTTNLATNNDAATLNGNSSVQLLDSSMNLSIALG